MCFKMKNCFHKEYFSFQVKCFEEGHIRFIFKLFQDDQEGEWNIYIGYKVTYNIWKVAYLNPKKFKLMIVKSLAHSKLIQL